MTKDNDVFLSELKPCPFCNSADIAQDYGSSFVVCNGCMAAAKAELWNTRTPSLEDIVAVVGGKRISCVWVTSLIEPADIWNAALDEAIAAIRELYK